MHYISMTRCLVGIALLCPSWALAQSSPRELNFKSKHDHFTLQKTGSRWQLDGRNVKLGSFEEFLNLFKTKIEGSCPTGAKADVTVTAKVDGEPVVRKFYIAERIASDGTQCATINGEGIYYIPLHRSYFDEDGRGKIPVKSPFKVTRGEEVLAKFEMQNGDWKNTQTNGFPNWEFFGTFREAISDFPISHRIHKGALKGNPDFVLTSGPAQYKFYKLGNIWFAALPSTPWLVGSNQWTSWLDMEAGQWQDRNAASLVAISDHSKPLEERRSTLAGLEGQWTPSIRDVLAQILLGQDEPMALKLDAVRMMKNKPIKENIRAMIQALGQTQDSDLLYALTQALKVRNPKGPVINTDMSDEQRKRAIVDWQAWWNGAKNSF